MIGIEKSRGSKRPRFVRRARPLAEVLEGRQLLATITVTSSGDADGADGGTTLSLRQAIEVANGTLAVSALTAGQQALVAGALSSPNTIDFDIPGTGPFVIKPVASLPAITGAITIDGYSQPGATPNTNGPTQADNAILEIEVDFSAQSSPGLSAGLQLQGAGSTAQGLAIGGNANGAAITLGPAAMMGGSSIQGNFIGTDTTGLVALPGEGYGVIDEQVTATIGGTTPAARNVISGNSIAGVDLGTSPIYSFLTAPALNALVEGNFIGTDATGAKTLPNGTGVLTVGSDGSTIGGTVAGAGNVISGNLNGINLDLFNPDDSHGGPLVGPTPSDDNAILGNLIGTDLTGSAALANSGYGVLVSFASGNTIGGTAAGAGNVIANNGQSGVGVASGQGNTIVGNSIFANGGQGIDLGLDGVTINTPNGVFEGPNMLQPYPVITATSGLAVNASLKALPLVSYTIGFYASPKTANGSGEGEFYLGSQVVTADSTGVATFSYNLPAADAGLVLSMTATDPDGNTSEFTPQVLPASNVPVVAAGVSTISVAQGQSITLIAAVGASALGQPTGLVGFVVDGTVVGFAPLNAQGFATLAISTSQLAIGVPHVVVAAYQGDAKFAPGFSSALAQFIVAPAQTVEIVGSSSITPQGQPINFAVAVGSPGTATPTGLVAFVADGTDILGFAPLDANGNAAFLTDQLAPGGHAITAVYLGDATHPSQISSAFGVGIVAGTVAKGPAVTSQIITGSNTVKVSFNQALLQASAQAVANYAITGPTGQAIAITAAAYDPSTRSVTLVTQQALNPKQAYKLTVKGVGVGGVEDVFGLALNAKGKGKPGSNTVGNIKA